MKIINSVSDLHHILSLPPPSHPLISVIRISNIRFEDQSVWKNFSVNFYCISLKRNVKGKARYGQGYYDYDKGVMTFISPMQIMSLEESQTDILRPASGYALFIHPDFFYGHPIAAQIRFYGFFSYEIDEALHLSAKEERDVEDVFSKIDQEYQHIDTHTQNIIISQIELLLNYSNRFYERQFITRKKVNHGILLKFEQQLEEYFIAHQALKTGIPTVEYFSDKLNLSAHYLSDLLRSLTGQSAQHHIQRKIIDKAKEYLSTTEISVSEIAYRLGFEHPQSLNKLFKKKTNLSPLTFRKIFR